MKLGQFKTEMDQWVKSLHGQIQQMSDIPALVDENTENIDHNYEIMQEMRAEIKKLKEEVSALRLVQLLHLKNDIRQKH